MLGPDGFPSIGLNWSGIAKPFGIAKGNVTLRQLADATQKIAKCGQPAHECRSLPPWSVHQTMAR
jgi:hypothetical protein